MEAEPHPVVVIGTGPTSFAAVKALIDGGRRVHVIDIGTDLPESVTRAIHDAKQEHPTSWTPETISALDGGDVVSRLAGKLYFGTDTPYRYPTNVAPIVHETGALLPISGALGGLSNVWGAGILSLSPSEFASWPVTSSEMNDSYVAVARHFPTVGCHDALDARYPWPFEPSGAPALSTRFRRFVSEERRAHQPGRVLIGASRLMVAPLGDGCTGCGRCLTGCPYGAIFDARNLFRPLIEQGFVTYQTRSVVESISETASGVQIRSTDLASQRQTTVDGDRVLIAAGSVSSVSILQRSGLCSPTVAVRDSQVFYVPLVLGTKWTDDSAHFTLAQAFVVSADSEPHEDFQLSIYDTSDELAQRFALMAPRPLLPLATKFGGLAARRVVGGIGFLPSELSGTLQVSTRNGQTVVRTVPGEATGRAVKRVVRRLGRALVTRGVGVVSPFVQIPDPGAGFHVGSALPMKHRPGPDETDSLGRPPKTDRIHVIDSTVLPRLHPGPTTFTAMANADRIARAICTR